MTGLATSLDAPPSGRAVPIWFDALAYCREKLLGGAPVPWTAPGELSAFFAKAQGMFRSDAMLVDAGDVFAQRAARDDALRAAMGARSRPGFPLRTLLADEPARTTAAEALTAIGGSASTTPVVLSIPSPGRWLALAARQAGTDTGAPPEARSVEAAAMYVADLLRVFAGARVDALLLDEGGAAADAIAPVEAARPVLNVAAHYTWPVWVRTDAAPGWPQGDVEGVAGWLGARAPERAGRAWGIVLEADPAAAPDLPATGGGAVLAVVPAAADPDRMMAWVRALA